MTLPPLDDDDIAAPHQKQRVWSFLAGVLLLGILVIVGAITAQSRQSQEEAQGAKETLSVAAPVASQGVQLGQQVLDQCRSGQIDPGDPALQQICRLAEQLATATNIPTSSAFPEVSGEKGDPGPSGRDGEDGTSITGPAGPPGADGISVTGPQGPAGRDGPDGVDGQDGASVTGPPGPQGDPGTNGADGAPGADGQPPYSWTYVDPFGMRYVCARTETFSTDLPTYQCVPADATPTPSET